MWSLQYINTNNRESAGVLEECFKVTHEWTTTMISFDKETATFEFKCSMI